MKKIIFSSVCAVALLGVNAYANSVISTDGSSGNSETTAPTPKSSPINWETEKSTAEGEVNTTKGEFTGLAGVNDKLTAYTGAKTAYDNAVTALGAPKSGTTPATGAYLTLDNAIAATIGSSEGVELKAKAQVSTLNELLKYYQENETDKDPAKAAAVSKIIAKVKAGLEVTDDDVTVGELDITEGFTAFSPEAYDNAVTGLADAIKAVEDAKADIDTKKVELAKLEAELVQAIVATPQGQAKVTEIEKSLGSLRADSGVAGEKLIALLASETTEFKDLDATADKELIATIQKAANEVAQAIIDNKKDEISQSALGALNLQINNMNKRLGEVRGMGADTGVWLRTYGGRFSNDNDHFNYYSTQIGADRLSNIGNADLITGALIGFDKINASTKTKTYSVGAYASYIDNSGFFADAVLKYARASHKKDAWDYKKQNIFLASLEGGYRIEVNNGYIEPSLELITGHVGKYQASHKNTKINVDSFVPLVFKPQVYFGANIDDLTLRLGGGAVFNAKRPDAYISLNNIVTGLNANAKTKLDRNNHGFASIGGSYKFNDNLRLNLGLERSFGGKLNQDYEVNATIRYTF